MSSANILIQIGNKEIEKLKYETRKTQITSIKNNISNYTDSYVSNINNQIDELSSSLNSGISGISETTELTNSLPSYKEKYGNNDSFLSNYENYLNDEIQDCQTKINNLETDKSALNRQYSTALQQEAEDAKKKLKKLIGK